jgi:uncharacterized protein YkwD
MPRLALATLTCLLLGGCALPFGGSSAGGPSTTGGAGSDSHALAVARSDFFSNQYTVAEADYRKYVVAHPGDPAGHTAYALFLNYNRRFSEALSEIQVAVGQAPKDGYVAAINTRVHDWAAQSTADIKMAAQLGATAVRLGPRTALAHIFYSEALADSGDAPGAQREIDTAATLASGEYEKAEVEREKANLSLNQADHAAQLSHLMASRTLQPGWAERTRELAEYYYSTGDLTRATAEFQKAIAMAPTDAGLRVTLGNAALLQEDVTTAQQAYDAANKLNPHNPDIESTLAITSFATTRDTAASESLLRAAAGERPSDVGLAELLEGFLRYIKRDSAAADLVVVGKPPKEPINPDARFPVSVKELRQATNQKALDALNVDRGLAGLAPVKLDDRITEGATSHAYWWLFNLALPQVKGLGIHKEVSGTPGYTGYSMRDRATTFGYPQASMAEDITHRGSPDGAISDWVDSVYHRFPIMRPDLAAIGFGSAIGGGLPIEVMDMGYSSGAGDPNQQVVFPAAGQTKVPSVFLGNELPDPVPPGGKYPTGYPITINYDPYASVQVLESRLTDATGGIVDAYTIAPSTADENVYTILPKLPLKLGATYHVHVVASVQGNRLTRDWSFTTIAPADTSGPTQQA